VSSRHVVVMLATSYPRFPGDTIGTFMEPIAKGVAALGHEVHMVLPWHPKWDRPSSDGGVQFHVFRYAPHQALNVFGYAGALRQDTHLRWSAWASAPLGLAASFQAARRVAREVGATVLHGHWLVPSGAVVVALPGNLPTVISLHGSDVYVAERHGVVRAVARRTLARVGWVTACSDDLRDRTIRLGAAPDRIETVPYGVDADRFGPDPVARRRIRLDQGFGPDDLVLFAAGRFVSKKGFEFLIDAVASLAPQWPALRLVLAGGGDLDEPLRTRARQRGVADRVVFPGILTQGEVAAFLAASDIAVVPSVHDERGNVDGLPNTVMEALASGTPVVASRVAGIPSVITHGSTGWLVPERNTEALTAGIGHLLSHPETRAALGDAARQHVRQHHSWARVARQMESAYDRAAGVRRPV
jgi:glycosyltransferase involved in cell wall biosynthesis